MIESNNNIANLTITEFAKDVLEGLEAKPKKLSSKYFYDKQGDKLFQQIMHMPSYYLTDCEFEILKNYKAEFLQLIGNAHFDLIELGAGDGLKTKILLEFFLQQKADFTYKPIDISGNVLEELASDLAVRWPSLDVELMEGDYFEKLEEINYRSKAKKIILFMGANIGNLATTEAKAFLNQIYAHMDSGDLLIVGFDLKKDPEVVLEAYHDPEGFTAAFNLNLLHRMNKELGANFDVGQFKQLHIDV